MNDRKESDDTDENEARAAKDDDTSDESGSSEGKGDDDDDDDDDESSDDSEPATAAAPEKRSREERDGKARGRQGRQDAPRAASSVPTSRAGLFAVLALAAGAAAGWFGHTAQAKARLRAESAPAPSGSAAARGPCGTWEQKLCASGGDQSALCQQAKAASEILTPGTCEVALDAVPATLARVKAERAPCDQLMSKLCADLPPESGACKLVKEKTPSFPTSRCTEMLGKYAPVLEELKQIDQQMAGQGKPSPHGMPAMGRPPGAPGAPHP